MANTNKTVFTPVFTSETIPTNDARKTLMVQTVVASTDTITINLVQSFTSDTKKDSAYSKAIAFNVDDKGMMELLKAFKTAQETLNATVKARPELQARPKATASKTISVTGAAQVKALLDNGLSLNKIVELGLLTETEALAYVESMKPKAENKKPAPKAKKAAEPAPTTDFDTLLESFTANIKKGGRK